MEYKQPKLKIIQDSVCRWHIETEKGIILKEDIMLGLKAEAEEYISKYITSYLNWDYEIVPLEEK